MTPAYAHTHAKPAGGGGSRFESRRFDSAPPLSPRHSPERGWGSRHASDFPPPPYPGASGNPTADHERAGNAADSRQTAFRAAARTYGRPNYVGLGVSESHDNNLQQVAPRPLAVSGVGYRSAAVDGGATGAGGGAGAGWKSANSRFDDGDGWRLRVAPPVDDDGHISPAVKVIDRFQVVQLLDKGTFGTVFRAWDPKWRQFVALKVRTCVCRDEPCVCTLRHHQLALFATSLMLATAATSYVEILDMYFLPPPLPP